MLSFQRNKDSGKGKASAPAPLKSAEELLRGIPDDPVAALQQLSTELDQLNMQSALPPAQIHQLVDLIDRTGRPYYRTLADIFLQSDSGLTKFQEQRIWTAVTAYVTQLARGYRLCLAFCEVGAQGAGPLVKQLPEITMRALRACALRLKWAYLSYQTAQFGHWGEMSSLYVLAERAGFANRRMAIYRSARDESSVEQEFLHGLLLAISSPSSMTPAQIEVADRLISRCGTNFVLSLQPSTACTHVIDVRADTGPQRLQGTRGISTHLRAFGAGPGLDELIKLDGRIRDGDTLLGELGLAPDLDSEVVHATVAHLVRQWGAPSRRHERKREATSVTVLHGFEEVAARLGNVSFPFVSQEERWIVDNRSQQGLHAMVNSPLGRWLSVGSLVAFREGDNAIWTTGLVRRLTRTNDDTRMVAVETLAHGGAGVTVLPHPTTKRESDGTLCVLLPGPNGVGEQVRLLLPPNTFSESTPLVMRAYDRRYLLFPVRLLENSVDCQVARYKILRPAN